MASHSERSDVIAKAVSRVNHLVPDAYGRGWLKSLLNYEAACVLANEQLIPEQQVIGYVIGLLVKMPREGMPQSVQNLFDRGTKGRRPSLTSGPNTIDWKFLDIAWIDYAGVIRAKTVRIPAGATLDHLPHICSAEALHSLVSFADIVPEGCGLTWTKELAAIPDKKTLHAVPWKKGTWFAMPDLMNSHGNASDLCPRRVLNNIVSQMISKFGLTAQIGFEVEFNLLDKAATFESVSKQADTGYANYASSIRYHEFVTVLTDYLEHFGVEVSNLHFVGGEGTIEISLAHKPPLQACESAIKARMAVHAAAAAVGKAASFLPKIRPAGVGVGAAVHVSVWQKALDGTFHSCIGGEGKETLTETTQHFVAGCLAHLPSLMAISAPNVNSYRRHAVSTVSWGFENREAAIRIPVEYGVDKAPTNFEYRVMDSTSNPYFVVSMLLASGIDGLTKKLALPKSHKGDPNSAGAKPLPKSLSEAVEELQKDQLAKIVLGDRVFLSYVAGRAFEAKHMQGSTLEKEFNTYVWKF
jgi:glutamine synthetase